MFFMNLLWKFGVVAIAAVDDIISSSAPSLWSSGGFPQHGCFQEVAGTGWGRVAVKCSVSLVKVKLLQDSGCLFVCLFVDSDHFVDLYKAAGWTRRVFTGSVLTVCVFLLQDDRSSVHQLRQWSECSPLCSVCCFLVLEETRPWSAEGNITLNLLQFSCRPFCKLYKMSDKTN